MELSKLIEKVKEGKQLKEYEIRFLAEMAKLLQEGHNHQYDRIKGLKAELELLRRK